MPRLLHLDSSADRAGSRSRAITGAFAEAWTSRGSEYEVTYRDLHRHPLPHLGDATLHFPARLRPADATPPADDEAVQQELLDELLAADALVIGAPLYNYSMPSTLKAWIDHIHVPGVTAPFDIRSQPMAGKPAVVVSSRGAVYDAGSPTADWDHGTPALELILGTSLGMAVSVIVTSRTLAETVSALSGERDAAQREFAAALARGRELGSSV